MAIISAWDDTSDDSGKGQKYRAMKAGKLADTLLAENLGVDYGAIVAAVGVDKSIVSLLVTVYSLYGIKTVL